MSMPVLLFLHLVGVIVWVGGMFFVHFILRPVAVATLPPPVRLPLMAAVLGRFLPVVGGAIVLIVASGVGGFVALGGAGAPHHWHPMAAIGCVMALIYGYIYGVPFQALQRAVAAGNWPEAGAALGRIRPLVAINLGLGFLTVAVATLGALPF